MVIDDNPEVREAFEEMGVLHIEGRPSDDEVLRQAGIERARAVVACIDSDAENIFATLTARELRPDIQIVARAAQESSERKLIRAGANDVISPYKTSGRAMAQLALDSERAGIVMDLLRGVARENDAAVVVVTHDEKIFDRLDEIFYLRDGWLVPPEVAPTPPRPAIASSDMRL